MPSRSLLHNSSFCQDQYFKIPNVGILEKLLPDCKLGIKTFKTRFSGEIEVAKMQNTVYPQNVQTTKLPLY